MKAEVFQEGLVEEDAIIAVNTFDMNEGFGQTLTWRPQFDLISRGVVFGQRSTNLAGAEVVDLQPWHCS